CTRCQSFIEPSSAEYWHMGEMTMRFGSVMPPSWIGVKSSGCGNRDSFFRKRGSQRFCKQDRIGLVAVDAQRVGSHRHPLAGEAGDVAALDHPENLLQRLVCLRDHAAGLVARRELAGVGI